MNPVFSAAARGVLALLLAGVTVAAQTGPDADALFAMGVRLHQAGDVVGAIEAYEAALEKDPERVDARSNLGAAFAGLGRYDEAIRHYQAVLARRPDQVAVRFNLALAFYKADRVAEAAEELERVVGQEPGNRSALLLLADCLAQMGNDAGVVSLLSPREDELKDDRLYAYLLGNALLRRNELLRGQAYIDRLFQGGETAQARLLMGVAHLRREDYRAAVPDLQRAVDLDPSVPAAHSLLGRALMGTGRRDEAVQAFKRALETNPNDFDANLYLGLALKDDGKLDEAYEHLKRAGRLRSQNPGVLYALGALHLAAGRVEEAQKALESVTAQVPDYRQAHVLLATAYYRQKNKELGDRHQAIAEKLRAADQAHEPGAADELGPAYRGDDVKAASPPR
jgi:tetratricopeptide (TPR) repeat protein